MFSLKNFLMAALLVFAVSFCEIAEAGIITDRLPFWCYVDHQVNTYDQPNGNRVGYISANVDLIRVTQIRSDGWAYGDYPVSNGRRERWFRITELCADPAYHNRRTNMRGAQGVFRLPNGNETIGSVSNNESVIVIADNGNRAQIVYRLDNGTGYKVGWVSSSSVAENGGGNSGTNIKGDANNDGRVDENDVNLIKNYIVGNIGDNAINKNNADFNSDGQIDIFDAVGILSNIKNNPNPTSNSVTVNLNVPILKQSDSRWSEELINYNGVTIGKKGCTITSLAMKYNFHKNANATPVDIRNTLKANGGLGGTNGNDVIYDGIKRAFGYENYIVSNKPALNNEWMKRIYALLKAGKPVIIGAYRTDNWSHWVIIKGYTGNSDTNFNAADFQINDPQNNFSNLQQFIDRYYHGLRGIIY